MSQAVRKLRIGVIGCGPIAQFAHFDACRKARNAELYAICDLAADLRERMAAVHQPVKVYADAAELLTDPKVEAVIVAVADQFHVALCRQAIAAGKHVLVEKPLGVSVEECAQLATEVRASGLVLQVGNNRRFDPGVAFARWFIVEEMGGMLALKAWYCDSTLRYTMTDNLQPLPVTSAAARKPEGNLKADRRRYLLMTHGSHLVDTVRCLGGELVAVWARLIERFESYCWMIAADFADGAAGQLDLTVPLRGDFEEGFQIYGQHGSVNGRLHLPWYHKAGEVECFSAKDRVYRRPLGEDAYTYKLQIEAFAATILDGVPQAGASAEDGTAAVRALVAIARSVQSGERVRLGDVSGGV